jgi:diguanylate cyclase (GGDEF)-like protein
MQTHTVATTGLTGRTGLLEQAAHELAVAERGHGAVALVVLRLAQLDEIEAALGRPAADALRSQAARRVSAALGPYDGAGDVGADRFAVLLPGIAAQDARERIAPRLVALLSEPFEVAGRTIHLVACSGTAGHPGTAGGAEALLDAALAAARR